MSFTTTNYNNSQNVSIPTSCSSTSPKDESIFTQALRFGASNDVDSLTRLYSKVQSPDQQHFVDMALIGSTSIPSSTAKEASRWALKNGACELWGIQQEPNTWTRLQTNETNKRATRWGG